MMRCRASRSWWAFATSSMVTLACGGEVVLGDLRSDGSAPNGGSGSKDGSAGDAIPAPWPNRDDTGASGTLRPVSGDVTLDQDGEIYENVSLDGTIVVTACDVTLRNVEVHTGSSDYQRDLFAIWLQNPSVCPVTLDHVTVEAKPPPNHYITMAIRSAYGSPVAMRSIKIIGTQGGILGPGSGVIENSYILLGTSLGGEHNNALQLAGSSDLLIFNNTVQNPNASVAALALFADLSANRNLRVEGNLVAGGNYTCFCGDGEPNRALNVDIVRNVFWRKYFPNVGFYAPGHAFNANGGGEWTDNRYMNADGDLTNELVNQPAPAP